MINKQEKANILQDAVEAFKKNIEIPIEIGIEAAEPNIQLDAQVDRILRMTVRDKELRFYADVKTNLTNVTLAQVVLHKINETEMGEVMLVTRHVNPQMANQLKGKGIQFIDTAGNAYINQPPLYIFVKGNRPPEAFRPVPMKRAFKPTGLRIIFAFLCNPGLENRPYREIAAIANVALGTVGWIMRDLKEMGYLLDMGKRGKKLVEKEKFFALWVTAYPEQLRPKLILGRYKGATYWWENKILDVNKAQWGGEVAAAKLTQYLKPQDATLYIDPAQLTQIIIDNRLRKDPAGDTEILERFWKPTKEQLNENTVHPLLIYADLLATGNQRNIETAKIIYEQYIIRFIRED
jgi:hypothetical protein